VLDNIGALKRKFSASRLNLRQAQAKIRSLTSQLGKALQEVSDVNPTQSPADCSYLDIVKNYERLLTRRRSSFDTLVWAQQLHAIIIQARRKMGQELDSELKQVRREFERL
jgi:hypothetical protein